jgi:hypothetical protein
VPTPRLGSLTAPTVIGDVLPLLFDASCIPTQFTLDSVRIESYARYDGGLFILDLNKAPWGCGTCLAVSVHPFTLS